MGGMAKQATISVRPSTRNRVRELKGFERTYDELLREMLVTFERNEQTIRTEDR